MSGLFICIISLDYRDVKITFTLKTFMIMT